MFVQLQNVRKNYGDFQLDCSFHLKEGQITGLIGQNGAGKTTAFKMILGLTRLDKLLFPMTRSCLFWMSLRQAWM